MGKFNIHNFFSNSVSNNAKEAVNEWILKRYDETELAQYCELCGTRIKRYYLICNQITEATLFIGSVCYRSMLNYFEKNNLKTSLVTDKMFLDKSKDDFNKLLSSKYENIVEPGHWIKWTVNQLKTAPPDVQKAIRFLKKTGYVDNNHDRKILIEYHDNNRKFSRDVLLPNWRKGNIFPPDILTIIESKKYINQYGKNKFHSTERSINKIRTLRKKKYGLSDKEKIDVHEKNRKKVKETMNKIRLKVEQKMGKNIFTLKSFNEMKEEIQTSRMSFNELIFSYGQAKELIKQCGFQEVVKQYNKNLHDIDKGKNINKKLNQNNIKNVLILKTKKRIENLLVDYLSKIFKTYDLISLDFKLKKLNVISGFRGRTGKTNGSGRKRR